MVILRDKIVMIPIPSSNFNLTKKWNDVQLNTPCSNRCSQCSINPNKRIPHIILLASTQIQWVFQCICPHSKTSISLLWTHRVDMPHPLMPLSHNHRLTYYKVHMSNLLLLKFVFHSLQLILYQVYTRNHHNSVCHSPRLTCYQIYPDNLLKLAFQFLQLICQLDTFHHNRSHEHWSHPEQI